MKPFQFDPAARAELMESRDFYEARRKGLGKRFLTAVQAAAVTVQQTPEAFRAIEPGIRYSPVRRFPSASSIESKMMPSKSSP
jgi:hypothetical protein